MYKWMLFNCLTLIFLAACGEMDMDQERKKLLETDINFSEDAQKIGVAEAFRKYADENAVMLPAGSQPLEGIAAISQILESPSEYILKWVPVKAEVSKSGDLGYTWGRYSSRFTNMEGNIIEGFGKYVSIWEKQIDGSWKWIVDIGNNNPKPD